MMLDNRGAPQDAGRFRGRVAIVTGGASGIGRATAERLAGEGARVLIADVQASLATDVARRLDGEGTAVVAVACEVADPVAVRHAVAECHARYGRIDVLVNVAGGSSAVRQSAIEMPIHEFKRVLDVNLAGTYVFVQQVLPLMVEQRYGRIVNVSSTAAFVTSDRTTPAYASAKAAIVGLTRQIVYDYSRFGITANAVAPGHIRTALALRLGEERLRAKVSAIPIGRLGEPEDVAAAIAFLASEEAGFLTGQVLTIDGGQTSTTHYAAYE